jgi:hypothetical protein
LTQTKGRVRVNLHLERGVHARLKEWCIRQGKTLQDGLAMMVSGAVKVPMWEPRREEFPAPVAPKVVAAPVEAVARKVYSEAQYAERGRVASMSDWESDEVHIAAIEKAARIMLITRDEKDMLIDRVKHWNDPPEDEPPENEPVAVPAKRESVMALTHDIPPDYVNASGLTLAAQTAIDERMGLQPDELMEYWAPDDGEAV